MGSRLRETRRRKLVGFGVRFEHRGSDEEGTRLMKQNLRNTKVGECCKGILELVSRKEDSAWLNGSYIGVVHPSIDIFSLQNQLPSLHNFGCELRSLGDREVLISIKEEEGVVRLLAEDNSGPLSVSLPCACGISPSRTETRSCLLFARIVVHTKQLARIDESVKIRVDGAPFTIRVSEEMVSCEDMFRSEAADSDGCKKLYLMPSRDVFPSPSHVEESSFIDWRDSPVKSFLGMEVGLTLKQRVTGSQQGL
ncbi:hypothetical protein Ancab_001785 [Ancistrocladus abbreviatus]